MGEPSKTIHYATQALNIATDKTRDRKTRIKAFMRRALAFEEKDKLKHAQKDYQSVKMMDPANMAASKGLYRISQEMAEKKAQRDEYDRLQEEKGRKARQGDESPGKKSGTTTSSKNINKAKQSTPNSRSDMPDMKWSQGGVPKPEEPEEKIDYTKRH